ncbi:hypothetical protein DRO61_12065 [Candidatus Bathyarchaeota archaeon]|nr:MAG: hypothetical protein DRO61_12065 [Candidatus Bathyarchaeota archaeon]
MNYLPSNDPDSAHDEAQEYYDNLQRKPKRSRFEILEELSTITIPGQVIIVERLRGWLLKTDTLPEYYRVFAVYGELEKDYEKAKRDLARYKNLYQMIYELIAPC